MYILCYNVHTYTYVCTLGVKKVSFSALTTERAIPFFRLISVRLPFSSIFNPFSVLSYAQAVPFQYTDHGINMCSLSA